MKYFILLLLAFLISCKGEKKECFFIKNESKIKLEKLDLICDSLNSLKMFDKSLFIHLSNKRGDQRERWGISKNLFPKDNISKTAVVFFYYDSNIFDIIFSDSLKVEKFLTNRMHFVNALKSKNFSNISTELLITVINDFKEIDVQ